jgi:hypothetical protein
MRFRPEAIGERPDGGRAQAWTARTRAAAIAVVCCAALLGTGLEAQRGFGGGGRGGQAPGPGRGFSAGPRDPNQGTAVGTGSISGSVVLQGSGTPVRHARVTLTGADLRGGRTVLSDENGNFVFAALPAGRFTLAASKTGFVAATYGARRPGRPGTPIQLAEGQQLTRADLTMPRGSVITGIVVDEHGEPSPGTSVRALKYVMRTGERTVQPFGSDQTDDRGIYRIYDLQPGEYLVTAVPRNVMVNEPAELISTQLQTLIRQVQEQSARSASGLGAVGFGVDGGSPEMNGQIADLQQQLASSSQERPAAYAPVYYPGTTSPASASPIMLGVGEERTGVDFQLQLVPTSKLDGTVTNADGSVPTGAQVALVSAEPGSLRGVPGVGTDMARVGPDGTFSFRSVTPGQYRLEARAVIRKEGAEGTGGRGRGGRGGLGVFPGQIAQVLWARADVTVNGQDTPPMVLTLQPGMTVGGHIDLEGTAPSGFDFTRVRLTLSPRGTQGFDVSGPVPPADVDASGHFTITGIAPGSYTLGGAVVNAGQTAFGRGGIGRGETAAAGSPGDGPWFLKSAVVNGRDTLDFPLDVGPGEDLSSLTVTFSTRSQQLTGTIQNASGRPVPDFTIIVFPSDSRYWLPQSRRISSSRPGTDGQFSFRNLPAGDYRMTAVTDAEPGEWYDPAFLTQLLPASIPIALTEGEKKVQDIRVAGN